MSTNFTPDDLEKMVKNNGVWFFSDKEYKSQNDLIDNMCKADFFSLMNEEQKSLWAEDIIDEFPGTIANFPAACIREGGEWMRDAEDLENILSEIQSCSWIPEGLFDFQGTEINGEDHEYDPELTFTYKNKRYSASFDEHGVEYLHGLIDFILQENQSPWTLLLHFDQECVSLSPIPRSSINKLAEMEIITHNDLSEFDLS